MAGYTATNRLLSGATVAVAAPSDVPVTGQFIVKEEDARDMLLAVTTTGISGTVNITLQHSFDGGTTFIDTSITAAVTTNVTTQLTHSTSEASTATLWPIARVVADGAGSANITAVWVSSRT